MFIKDQSGSRLVEIKGIVKIMHVGVTYVKYTIVVEHPNSYSMSLGEYDTQERAEQVIELIADSMFHGEKIFTMPEA